MAFTDHSKLKHYQARVSEYLERREEGSLVFRFPKGSGLDLASQVAQWLFAFDAAALALLKPKKAARTVRSPVLFSWGV